MISYYKIYLEQGEHMGCIWGKKSKTQQLPKGGVVTSNIQQTNSEIQLNGKAKRVQTTENADDDDILQSHQATSKVYRRSSKEKGGQLEEIIEESDTSSKIHHSEINLGIPPETADEIMEGIIRQELTFSRIKIYTPSMALEFTIPKKSAGPVIVPYVDYTNYLADISVNQKQ